MRVLLCTPWDISHGGGISRWAHHIVSHYKGCDICNLNIDICSMDRSSYLDEIVSPIKRAYLGLRDYYSISKIIIDKVNKGSYDIVHLVSSASISLVKDIYILWKLKRFGVKTVIHFHFGRIPQLFEQKNWEYRLMKTLLKLADKVVVLDKMSYDTLVAAGYKNIDKLPNPLSPQISKIIENNINVEQIQRKILFVGHLYRTKGVFELVEACNKISDISLTLVGQYEESIKNELLALADKKENSDWIKFTSNIPMEQVIGEMKSCDLFVLPTYTEGFPNVIIESMACGCAIVTTPVGAIPEMLEEENGKYYGILVPPQNTQALKDGIEAMLNNEQLKTECRNNVQQRVNERYNIDAIWRQMLSIWTNTITNNE